MLTGATGTMGWAGLQELLKRTDRFNIVVLVRDSEVNKKKLAPYLNTIKVVWGNLLNYNDVLRAVEGADYVLHVGGMVSPKCDYYPQRTLKTNITAAENVAKAVLAQPNADDIKVCYIGSVAQTSDRSEPIHWGRTGDPISISVYDHYAISKTIAERTIVESGIKHWVCLRQSGILYPEILKNYDPIMFHVPLRGVLEWATVDDSGRVLANLCEQDVAPEFWNHFYNIGSGEEYRLTNYEFECKLLNAISCPAPEKIFDPEWFVLRNFHGQWYLDADKLEEFLHFRANIPVDEYFRQMGEKVPKYFHLAKLCPPIFIKMAMKAMANKEKWGTQYWIKHNVTERINAYYGSKEAWENIPSWDQQKLDGLERDPKKAVRIDHGYDESKPREEWTIDDMQQAAQFRGGRCLTEMAPGTHVPAEMKLEWECAHGHRFTMSAVLVLEGGHWCPECLPMPWNYDEEARVNPFFAQVWTPIHGTEENNVYSEHIFDGWE